MNRRNFLQSILTAGIAVVTLSIPFISDRSKRKLKAKWTPELAQDLKSFHGMEAEEELMKTLSEQIRHEIDNEILKSITAGRV